MITLVTHQLNRKCIVYAYIFICSGSSASFMGGIHRKTTTYSRVKRMFRVRGHGLLRPVSIWDLRVADIATSLSRSWRNSNPEKLYLRLVIWEKQQSHLVLATCHSHGPFREIRKPKTVSVLPLCVVRFGKHDPTTHACHQFKTCEGCSCSFGGPSYAGISLLFLLLQVFVL